MSIDWLEVVVTVGVFLIGYQAAWYARGRLNGYDTALRATITQQAQEITRLEGEARGNHARIEQLDAQLATVTAELQKKTQWLVDISQAVAWKDAETLAHAVATVVKGLEAQLAAAQAKIDQQNQQLAKAALVIQERQATLAAREARIRELEDQMNAKRYFTNEAL
jgi:chromosome segregation ATPase